PFYRADSDMGRCLLRTFGLLAKEDIGHYYGSSWGIMVDNQRGSYSRFTWASRWFIVNAVACRASWGKEPPEFTPAVHRTDSRLGRRTFCTHGQMAKAELRSRR